MNKLIILIFTFLFLSSRASANEEDLKLYVCKSTKPLMIGGDTFETVKIYGLKNKYVSDKINFFLEQVLISGKDNTYYGFENLEPNYSFGRNKIIDSCLFDSIIFYKSYNFVEEYRKNYTSIYKNIELDIINNFLVLHISLYNDLNYKIIGSSNNYFNFDFIFSLSNGNMVSFFDLFEKSTINKVDSLVNHFAFNTIVRNEEYHVDLKIISQSDLVTIMDSIVLYNDSSSNLDYTEDDFSGKSPQLTSNLWNTYYIFDGISPNPFYYKSNNNLFILANIRKNLFQLNPINGKENKKYYWIRIPICDIESLIKKDYLLLLE